MNIDFKVARALRDFFKGQKEVKVPQGCKRIGFRLSDAKTMARFVEYAKIRNFKIFNYDKMDQVCESFNKDLHSGLVRGWRKNNCGRKLASVQGNPYEKGGTRHEINPSAQ